MTRSRLSRFRHYCFGNRRRMIAAILIALIPTAVVVIAFPVGNRVAESKWKNYRGDWERRGEIFDLEALLEKPPADADNFAKAPLISELYPPPQAEATNPAPGRLASFNVFGDKQVVTQPLGAALAFQTGRSVDLAAYLPQPVTGLSPAETLLDVFAPHEPVIAELMEAGARPGASYPFNLDHPAATRLHHLPVLMPAIHGLRLHNLALIESGGDHRDLAAGRVAGTLRVIRHGTECPGLASYAMRTMALESAGLEVVWQALYRRGFTDSQWREIGGELRAFSFGPRLLRTLRFERAALIRQTESQFDRRSARPFSPPPAWVGLNGLLDYVKLTQRYWFTDSLSADRPLWDAPRIDQLAVIESLASETEPSLSNLPTTMGVLPVHDFAVRARFIESQRDHALVAIALERHRLAHGSFPESLRELVPEWMEEIPANALTHHPPRYERATSGTSGGEGEAYQLRTLSDDPGANDPEWLMPAPRERPARATR